MKPFISTLNIATVDGRIAPRPGQATEAEAWQQLTRGSGQRLLERIRASFKPQVTLGGSGSFVRDGEQRASPFADSGPRGTELHVDFLPDEVVNRSSARGWYAVVDSRGLIPWAYKEKEGWHLLLLVSQRTPPGYLNFLRQKLIPYLMVGEARVDLRLAISRLAEKLGVTRILSEGGGRLNGALLSAGIVDEINVVVIPAIAGVVGTPAVVDLPASQEWVPQRLRLLSAETVDDGHVWVRYAVLPSHE